MESLTVEEAIKKIRIYLSRDTLRPYFVISDDMAQCKRLKNFFDKTFDYLYISDFCEGDFPIDTDLLVEKLNSLEKNVLVFGLGEYIHFTGQENILRMLQDRSFSRKVIFICRSVTNLLEKLADEDFKFHTNQICRVVGQENFSVVKYNPEIKFKTDAEDFTELLKLAEGGKNFITVKSRLPLINVKEMNNFYDALKNREPHFSASADALNENQWQEYFSDDKCEGYAPEHWRSFAAGFKNKIANRYLKYVYEHSANYDAYRRNLFFALIDVDEKVFEEFYWLRKSAVKNISAQYLTEYLEQLEKLSLDATKYLTDNTAVERRAMIQYLQGKQKIPTTFKKNYPAMKDYLADYDFGNEEITNYFRRYKKIKLCNVDDENFKNIVQEFSLSRPYNKFVTRQTILDKADKKSKLYWLDALGVEFLSYIEARATQLRLFVKIEIARAELPTLTSINKNFYDEWRGAKFEKNSELDELKHSQEKFNSEGKCSAPTYIDDELMIIDKVLDEIKITLLNHQAEKIILTSDHGASRLAVMYGRENKYKMNSAGEHSGRCCLINNLDEKPACACEENGYWIMANYDRFSGGRLSSIEVHGGATLEEILVPVIEISLQNEKIKSTTKEKISEPQKKSDDAFDFLLD